MSISNDGFRNNVLNSIPHTVKCMKSIPVWWIWMLKVYEVYTCVMNLNAQSLPWLSLYRGRLWAFRVLSSLCLVNRSANCQDTFNSYWSVITSFPKMSSSELLPRLSPVCHKVKIYCSCRMPWGVQRVHDLLWCLSPVVPHKLCKYKSRQFSRSMGVLHL